LLPASPAPARWRVGRYLGARRATTWRRTSRSRRRDGQRHRGRSGQYERDQRENDAEDEERGGVGSGRDLVAVDERRRVASQQRLQPFDARQQVTVVEPGSQPRRGQHPRDCAGAGDGNEERAGQARQQARGQNLTHPGAGRPSRVSRYVVAPVGDDHGRYRCTEQQDHRERYERGDVGPWQPRVGGRSSAEPQRAYHVPGGTERKTGNRADGQRGWGNPRPCRGEPQDGRGVQRHDNQEHNLAVPLLAKARSGDETVQAQVKTTPWGRVEDLLDDVLGRYQGQDRAVVTDAQQPGCPAAAWRAADPADQHR